MFNPLKEVINELDTRNLAAVNNIQNPYLRGGVRSLRNIGYGALNTAADLVSMASPIGAMGTVASIPQQIKNAPNTARSIGQGIKRNVDYYTNPQKIKEDPSKLVSDSIETLAGFIPVAGAPAVARAVTPKIQRVYHGTPNQNIRNLSTNYAGVNTNMKRSGTGINLTPSVSDAEFYATLPQRKAGVTPDISKAEILEVGIPQQSELIDLTLPLNKQPIEIQNYAKSSLGDNYYQLMNDKMTGVEFQDIIRQQNNLPVFNEVMKATKKKGVYTQDYGSPEYVIFNDKDVKILDRKIGKPTTAESLRKRWYDFTERK